MADDAAFEAVHRVDVIAGDQAHAFSPFVQVGLGDQRDTVLADDADAGIAPSGIACDVAHQVHDVGAEHHQVLAAGALILLASAAHLKDIADAAVGDQVLDALEPRAVARLMRDTLT